MARSAMYRRLDRFCRIVLPAELRQGLDLKGGTELEFRLEGDTMVVSRRRTGCSFCGGASNLMAYRDRRICGPCRASLRRRMSQGASGRSSRPTARAMQAAPSARPPHPPGSLPS